MFGSPAARGTVIAVDCGCVWCLLGFRRLLRQTTPFAPCSCSAAFGNYLRSWFLDSLRGAWIR